MINGKRTNIEKYMIFPPLCAGRTDDHCHPRPSNARRSRSGRRLFCEAPPCFPKQPQRCPQSTKGVRG